MRPGLKGLERAEFDHERQAHKASHLENLKPKNEESLTMRPRALGLTSLLSAFRFYPPKIVQNQDRASTLMALCK